MAALDVEEVEVSPLEEELEEAEEEDVELQEVEEEEEEIEDVEEEEDAVEQEEAVEEWELVRRLWLNLIVTLECSLRGVKRTRSSLRTWWSGRVSTARRGLL